MSYGTSFPSKSIWFFVISPQTPDMDNGSATEPLEATMILIKNREGENLDGYLPTDVE